MKKKILLDLFFYLAVPLISWNLFQGELSDYLRILLGLIPGVIYTAVSFGRDRQWNVTGLFFLVIITANLAMNLLSTTALEELWNPVWLNCAVLAFYALTMLVKRPIGMYFFIDYAYSHGVPRARSKALYSNPRNSWYFYAFTGYLMLREIVSIGVKAVMIRRLGVAGYDDIQLAGSFLNYAFTGLMVVAIVYILKHVDRTVLPEKSTDREGVRSP